MEFEAPASQGKVPQAKRLNMARESDSLESFSNFYKIGITETDPEHGDRRDHISFFLTMHYDKGS